jgi:hypothetical protein
MNEPEFATLADVPCGKPGHMKHIGLRLGWRRTLIGSGL